jgi:hypothetical protein
MASQLLNRIRLSSNGVTVTVIPELGSKISSIFWDGHELLFQNPYRSLRAAYYGAPFSDFDASGIDECLPSIGACGYPSEPWLGISVPDHGELWSVPWAARQETDRIVMTVESVRFPYTVIKSIELLPILGLRIRYHLLNRSGRPFPFIWSAHPLLAIEPGSRIHLPAPQTVTVDWSREERLGKQFTTHPWPSTTDSHGNAIDLSLIGEPTLGYVEKLYSSRLDTGWCGVHHPSSSRWVGMVFSAESVPFVGLSINQGGWPVEGKGYFNLGLEPCNGYPDRLDLAVARGCYAVAPPGDSLTWKLDIYFGAESAFPANRMQSLAREALAA